MVGVDAGRWSRAETGEQVEAGFVCWPGPDDPAGWDPEFDWLARNVLADRGRPLDGVLVYVEPPPAALGAELGRAAARLERLAAATGAACPCLLVFGDVGGEPAGFDAFMRPDPDDRTAVLGRLVEVPRGASVGEAEKQILADMDELFGSHLPTYAHHLMRRAAERDPAASVRPLFRFADGWLGRWAEHHAAARRLLLAPRDHAPPAESDGGRAHHAGCYLADFGPGKDGHDRYALGCLHQLVALGGFATRRRLPFPRARVARTAAGVVAATVVLAILWAWLIRTAAVRY